jgi:hypothetical protein
MWVVSFVQFFTGDALSINFHYYIAKVEDIPDRTIERENISLNTTLVYNKSQTRVSRCFWALRADGVAR